MIDRLQKIIASRGVTSRRSAEEMIEAGRVTVNGNPAHLGDKADPEIDDIRIDGNKLPEPQKEYTYILLHKPRGYVTSLSDEKGRADITKLIADVPCRLYPVGRLDMDSEGLLICTNDGELANRLMHPSHEVEKIYDVLVKEYTPEKEKLLRQPIVLDGYRIRAPKVRFVRMQETNARLLVAIHEGRNRQVRRMCSAAGMEVLRLRRIAEGPIRLGDLPSGKWRYLTKEEIDLLKAMFRDLAKMTVIKEKNHGK